MNFSYFYGNKKPTEEHFNSVMSLHLHISFATEQAASTK